MMLPDMELLSRYATSRSEEAFEALVSLHISLVYSAALRQVRDPYLAEEITQAVFLILARKAGSLSPKTILPGWLSRTTRYTAANIVRSESSRQRREQVAHMQSTTDAPDTAIWAELAPLLDEAMERLGQTDRDAIVLRYFENKSLQEVGMALGLQERAAQKRVTRGLAKLRAFFAKRGVALSATAIVGAVLANSVQAAPAGLAVKVTTAALVQGAASSGSTMALVKGGLKLMAWTKAKMAIAVAAGVLFVTGTTVTLKRYVFPPELNWDMTLKNLNSLPPVVIVRLNQISNNGGLIFNGKEILANRSLEELVVEAYGTPRERIIFPPNFPAGNYDLMLTVQDHPHEALQKELERQFGWVSRRATLEKDVLHLRVNHANAPGLKPGVGHGDVHNGFGPGGVSMEDGPIPDLANYLAHYFGKPVIDETGLSGHYDIHFTWKNLDDLKQVLRQQLGLELVPSHESIEMLVLEEAK